MNLINIKLVFLFFLILKCNLSFSMINNQIALEVLSVIEKSDETQFQYIDSKSNNANNDSQLLKNEFNLLLNTVIGQNNIGWSAVKIQNISCVDAKNKKSCLIVFLKDLHKENLFQRVSYFFNIKNNQIIKNTKIIVNREELTLNRNEIEKLVNNFNEVKSGLISGKLKIVDFLIESSTLRSFSSNFQISEVDFCTILSDGVEEIISKVKMSYWDLLFIRQEKSDITQLCGD